MIALLLALSLAGQTAPRLAAWDYAAADLPSVGWFQYQIDGGAPVSLGLPVPVTGTDPLTFQASFSDAGVPSGYHVLSLSACNTDGCSDPALASVTFTVGTIPAPPPPDPAPPSDTSAPSVSLSLSQNGKSKNYTFIAKATDNVAVVKVDLALDGRSPVPMALQTNGTWTAQIGITASGSHTVTVTAYDAAGNVGSASRTFTR